MSTVGPNQGDGRAAPPPDEQLVGGRYRTGPRIDRPGGVYAVTARDETTGQAVVIDFLDAGSDPASTTDAVRSAVRRVATASNPALVPTIDVVEHGNTIAIVSETVTGTTLAAMLREGPLAVGQAATIGRKVSGVLASLHAVGAHHGALTPDEIVIDRQGDTRVLGSAIGFLGGGAGGAAATTYAAPEQLTGQADGAPADLFALGVLLYEMVVGRPPIANWDENVVATSKVHDAPSPPSASASLVPKEYDELTVRLMDPRPIARPSAAEAEAALRRLEVPVLDRTVRASTVVVEPLPVPVEERRSIWPAVALAAVLGVIVALLIVWAVQDDGNQQKVVPTVVGQTQTAATATLRNEGFDVSASTAPNNGVPAGVVSEQSPLGGNKLKDKGTVAITVSSGPTTAPAPPIINVNPSAPSSTSTTSTSSSTTTTTTTTVPTPPPT